MKTRPRVLLFAEALTLAHVVRLVTIGRSLDPERYDVHLATDPRYRSAVGNVEFPVHEVRSMPAEVFHRAIATGAPIFDEPTLLRYVEDENRLFGEWRPDIVIGDFRISLAVSARLAGLPFINLTNAYWSPYAAIRHVLPEITLARVVGAGLGQAVFDVFRPLGYATHMRPVNRVRRRYGLAVLPRDFRYALADGDHVCYADIPEIVPTRCLPTTHSFVGPIPWSPTVAMPPWWDEVESQAPRRPLVYVTLGSSGPPAVLGEILQALDDMPVTVVATTAGAMGPLPATRNAYVAPFLPGERVARACSAVVCNGGSPTSYQGLAAGKPVIGVATNMDQFLNMAAVEDAGCGMLLRSGALDRQSVRSAVSRALDDAALGERARRIATRIEQYDWKALLTGVVDSALAAA